MRGHEALLTLRRNGHRPAIVHIHTDEPQPAVMRFIREAGQGGELIEIDPGEPVHRLDLRCIVAVPVIVGGADLQRVRQIALACHAAGAKSVVAVHHRLTGRGEFTECEVLRISATTEEIEAWRAS
jgi:hypothetical protein